MLYGYSASLNQTKPLILIAIGALLLNVLVNWLLVFGNLGSPGSVAWVAPGPLCCASGSTC